MEVIDTFFFDTYSLYEIIAGNPNYKKYSEGIAMITTKLNLMELHYALLRTENKKTADEKYDAYRGFVIEITDEIIKESNEFRLANKKRDLSYVDCVGYVLAKKHQVKFLTGDKQFEDMENVEFVK